MNSNDYKYFLLVTTIVLIVSFLSAFSSADMSAQGFNSSSNVSLNITQNIPANFTVGNITQFFVNVTNDGLNNFTNYSLIISYNGTLLNLTQASSNPSLTGQGMDKWNITLLQPNESYLLEANLTALTSGNTTVSFNVWNESNITQVSDDEPVNIQTMSGGSPQIILTKSLLNTPTMGGVAAFMINISNNGTQNITNTTLWDYYNFSFMTFTSAYPVQSGQNAGVLNWNALDINTTNNIIILVNFTTNTTGGDNNIVNITDNSGTRIAEANKPFSVSGGSGGGEPNPGPGLDSFRSSIDSPYLFYKESKTLNFELVRQTSTNDCLVNLSITLPANYTYTGVNSTTTTGADLLYAGKSLIWNNSDGFFCGNTTGFEGDANFTIGLNSTDDLKGRSFIIEGYKNDTNNTKESISLTTFTTIRYFLSGYVLDETRNGKANATATVSVASHNQNGDVNLGSFTANTTATGFFNITGIPSLNASPGDPGMAGQMLSYQLTAAAYNDSTNNYAEFVGPSLPDLPESMFKSFLDNPNITLKPAVTFRINVEGDDFSSQPNNINQSTHQCEGQCTFNQTNVSFGYSLRDKSLNFDVSRDFSPTGTMRYFSAPRARNYSLTVFPSSSFPINIAFNNIENYCSPGGTNISTTGVNAWCTKNGNQYLITATISAQMSIEAVNGTIKTSDNSTNFDSIYIIPYMLQNGNNFNTHNALPHNLGVMQTWPKNQTTLWDSYNATTGNFTLYLPATEATSNMMLVAYAQKGSSYYEGYMKVNTSGQVVHASDFNITVEPLANGTAGTVSSHDVANDWNETNVTNTTKITFNLVDVNGSLLTTENSFIEMKLSHDGLEYHKNIDASSGTFSTELFYGQGIDKLTVYSQNNAPLSRSVLPSEISNGELNITLKGFDLRDPNNLSKSVANNFNVQFYVSNSTCNVPNPPSGCVLFTGNKTEFSPMKAILYGDISFRMTSKNITINYANTDLLASGPPDALFTENSTGGSGLSQAWKFGSSGPDIYDNVIIGFPYNTSLDNETLAVNIYLLYDQDFNVIWNRSINTTAQLSSDYSDYLNSSYESYLNGTGVTCNNTDDNLSTGLCYRDNSTGLLWIKIPHFSGVGPTVTTVSAETNASTTTSSSSGSSGGSSDSGVTQTPTSSVSTASNILAVVFAGTPASFDFSGNSKIPIEDITITTKTNLSNAKLSVSTYDSKPSEVPAVRGVAFKYLSIDKEIVTNNDLISAKIKFRVDKSWFSNNNLNSDEISLYHYDGNSWIKLTTSVDSSDANYYYFSAQTPGFSYFAIAANKPVQNTVSPKINNSGNITAPAANVFDNSTKNETVSPQGINVADTSGNYSWIWYIVVLLVITVILYFVTRSPKHLNHKMNREDNKKD